MINVDWCLLFNLLPQLLWHGPETVKLQLNQRRLCVCTASVYLGVFFYYYLGYTAHHKATNTASLPNEECAIRGFGLFVDTIDSIILLFLCFYKTYFYNMTVLSSCYLLFYAFINYCRIALPFYFSYTIWSHNALILFVFIPSEWTWPPSPRVLNVFYPTLLTPNSFTLKNVIELPQVANRTECKQPGSKVWP